jgi:hypothetical protein
MLGTMVMARFRLRLGDGMGMGARRGMRVRCSLHTQVWPLGMGHDQGRFTERPLCGLRLGVGVGMRRRSC